MWQKKQTRLDQNTVADRPREHRCPGHTWCRTDHTHKAGTLLAATTASVVLKGGKSTTEKIVRTENENACAKQQSACET